MPDFADIDPVSRTLSPASLRDGWRPDTRAVVAVAYAGQAADLPAIAGIARARGAVVIDDACHAVGGAFHTAGEPNRPWLHGGNPWADLTTFSFHPVKTMTTGEGGMLVTDRAEWAGLARTLRSHGIARERDHFTPPDPTCPLLLERGPWFYEMQELGYNYRLTELQCALGLSQLRRLEDFKRRRRAIVAAYNRAFADLPWLLRPALRESADESTASWHLYTVELEYPNLRRTRTEVMAHLRSAGVGTQVLYIPVHLQPWYRRTYGYGPGKCPLAERFYERALSLPLFPDMTDADVATVVAAVRALADPSR